VKGYFLLKGHFDAAAVAHRAATYNSSGVQDSIGFPPDFSSLQAVDWALEVTHRRCPWLSGSYHPRSRGSTLASTSCRPPASHGQRSAKSFLLILHIFLSDSLYKIYRCA
jgi:hypothetical protein